MLEPRESSQIASLVKRAVMQYRHEVDFGHWKLRYQPPEYDKKSSQEIRRCGVAIFLPEEAHHAGGKVPAGGEWTHLCEEEGIERALERYLELIAPGELKLIAAAMRAKVAIPWMLPVKDFAVKVEHQDMPGARATIRMLPTNVCLATVTGIDAATQEINSEVADRLGAAWNVCAGLSTEDLIMISRSGAGRGQLKLLIEGLETVGSADSDGVLRTAGIVGSADGAQPERERG